MGETPHQSDELPTVTDINFATAGGLLPAVIQDWSSGEVLMVGYMDPEAWRLTLQSGRVHYYSRKKRRIWLKGEQSGHFQLVKEVLLNCDNTCLLIKVDQIGGACDQGLRSCFDKVLNGTHFESTGTKVFDPGDAYGENFTRRIVLGIPSGSLERMTLDLLNLAGFAVVRDSDRSYHPTSQNDTDLALVMARAQELPSLVAEGLVDAALTGVDMVEEAGVEVRDVADLGYNKLGRGRVMLALAVPTHVTVGSVAEMEGKRIATAYGRIALRFFEREGITVTVIPSLGATEGKVPALADAIVELVETGTTLQANHLKPVVKLYETSVHLIASNRSWGYTWKRRRMEDIAERLVSATLRLPQNPKQGVDLPGANTREPASPRAKRADRVSRR